MTDQKLVNIGCLKTALLTTEIGQYRNQASIEAAPGWNWLVRC
jgi:hypothetical protein